MKINPWYRIAATAGAVVIVAVLAGAYRMAESHGVFTTVKPGFAGSCRAVPSATGPEDIAIDAKSKKRLGEKYELKDGDVIKIVSTK